MNLSSPLFLRTRAVASHATVVRARPHPGITEGGFSQKRRRRGRATVVARERNGSPCGRRPHLPGAWIGAVPPGAPGPQRWRLRSPSRSRSRSLSVRGSGGRVCAPGPRTDVAPLPLPHPSPPPLTCGPLLKKRRVCRWRSSLPAGALWRTPAGLRPRLPATPSPT